MFPTQRTNNRLKGWSCQLPVLIMTRCTHVLKCHTAPQKDVQLLCVVKLCLSFPEPGLGFSSQCPWPWDRYRGSLSHSIIGHILKLSLAWTLFLTEQTQGGC